MSLCSSCRRTLVSRFLQPSSTSSRYASTIPPKVTPADLPEPISLSTKPAVSSSTPGVSQPLSTPHFPSGSFAKASPSGTSKSPSKIKSSVPGGQELKGLAYLKAKPHVLAKEDDEYPEWLWTLLDEPKSTIGGAKVDVASLTRKQREKYEKKQEKLLKNIPASIPLHEQSKDITGPEDDAITSAKRRQEIVKSSREARRKSIRESNFLKTM